jgi:hypothetical protein
MKFSTSDKIAIFTVFVSIVVGILVPLVFRYFDDRNKKKQLKQSQKANLFAEITGTPGRPPRCLVIENRSQFEAREVKILVNNDPFPGSLRVATDFANQDVSRIAPGQQIEFPLLGSNALNTYTLSFTWSDDSGVIGHYLVTKIA